MISKTHPKLSLQRQCEMLPIQRSGLYYKQKKSSKLNHEMMRLIDQQYLQKPYYGVYPMRARLQKSKENGFLYLMTIIDLKSRYVLNWSVSNSMDAEWCAEVFRETVCLYGAPKILNTDQGSKFISEVFTKAVIEEAGVNLSMDGKSQAIDSVFIERLWRSLKYEYLYLKPPTDGLELYKGIKLWFRGYNTERRHMGLNGEIPENVYYAKKQQTPEAA